MCPQDDFSGLYKTCVVPSIRPHKNLDRIHKNLIRPGMDLDQTLYNSIGLLYVPEQDHNERKRILENSRRILKIDLNTPLVDLNRPHMFLKWPIIDLNRSHMDLKRPIKDLKRFRMDLNKPGEASYMEPKSRLWT